MIAEFKTPVFKVYISGLADYLGIDCDSSPDYKVSKSKMLEWEMSVFALNNRLSDIEFNAKRVKFDFCWSVQEEYLGEFDMMNLQKKFEIAIHNGEISGWEVIDASANTGWDIQFAPFDLHSSSGYEKDIDEIEVNMFEKTILIR